MKSNSLIYAIKSLLKMINDQNAFTPLFKWAIISFELVFKGIQL